MTALTPRWDLSEIEVSASAQQASLRVVERLTRERARLETEWSTVIRLARSNGVSLRDIAKFAGVSAQTVANICEG